jgi:hypothetical protein
MAWQGLRQALGREVITHPLGHVHIVPLVLSGNLTWIPAQWYQGSYWQPGTTGGLQLQVCFIYCLRSHCQNPNYHQRFGQNVYTNRNVTMLWKKGKRAQLLMQCIQFYSLSEGFSGSFILFDIRTLVDCDGFSGPNNVFWL